MKRRFAVVAALLVTAAVVFAQAQGAGALLIVNANVVDGVSAEPIRGASVLLRGGKIEQSPASKPI